MGFKFSHKKRGKKFHNVYFEVWALLSEKPNPELLSGSFTNLFCHGVPKTNIQLSSIGLWLVADILLLLRSNFTTNDQLKSRVTVPRRQSVFLYLCDDSFSFWVNPLKEENTGTNNYGFSFSIPKVRDPTTPFFPSPTHLNRWSIVKYGNTLHLVFIFDFERMIGMNV